MVFLDDVRGASDIIDAPLSTFLSDRSDMEGFFEAEKHAFDKKITFAILSLDSIFEFQLQLYSSMLNWPLLRLHVSSDF